METVERLQERGYAAGDIAILVRRNSEATRIASMLLEHKRTHPESPYRYDVITQDALVIGRSPVGEFRHILPAARRQSGGLHSPGHLQPFPRPRIRRTGSPETIRSFSSGCG